LRLIFGNWEDKRRSVGAALGSQDQKKFTIVLVRTAICSKDPSNEIPQTKMRKSLCFALNAEDGIALAAVALARIGMTHLKNWIGEFRFHRSKSAPTAIG
jgi:2C-methyl-D-erythritol 2,4-cyclodiphosphate synthase